MKSSEAKALIGKRVRFFVASSWISRFGTIEEVRWKNVRIDGDWYWLPDLTLTLE